MHVYARLLYLYFLDHILYELMAKEKVVHDKPTNQDDINLNN